MAKKSNDEFYKKFAQAFHEVVVPVLEDMDKDFNKRFDSVETQLDSIGRTLTRTQERSYEHGDKLGNHEGRITKLERKATTAS